jgi:hypothetical protein
VVCFHVILQCTIALNLLLRSGVAYVHRVDHLQAMMASEALA